MNLSHCKRPGKAGFTLVELLVVIGIIAILAGVVLASVGSAIRMAKKTKANNTATSIATAIQNYDTEYGVYPSFDPGSAADDYYDGGSVGNWAGLTTLLLGNISPLTGASAPATGYTGQNARNIAYLSPTRSDVDKNGAIVNPFATASPTVVASGVPAPYFFMVVDTDYSGVVGDGAAVGKLVDFTGKNVAALTHGIPGGVAVWCSCDQKTAGTPSNFWAHTY